MGVCVVLFNSVVVDVYLRVLLHDFICLFTYCVYVACFFWMRFG